jgi:hypothetical protein
MGFIQRKESNRIDKVEYWKQRVWINVIRESKFVCQKLTFKGN